MMAPHDFQNLVETLAETRDILQRLVCDLPESDLRWKPAENQWSILEHLCHLRDIEREGYTVRIKRLLTEDQPFLADIDGDKLAEERDYMGQDFATAFDAFVQARRENTQAVQNLTESQLGRSGVFENTGPVTLETLLLMMGDHDQGHVQSVSQLRDQIVRRRG